MAIGFYFSGAAGSLQLPVNPEKLEVQYQGNNMRTEIVKLGEINILRDAKLASISMEFLLPGDSYYPFFSGPWRSPDSVVHFFRSCLEGKKPIRFVVSGLNLNMRMSVEGVTPRREAGDHDSIFCTLSLLQYRSYGAQVLSMPTTNSGAIQAAPPSRETDKPENATHTVASGESFWAIAQKELGDGSRYNEIAELNGMTAASVIHPGDVLKLPER